MTRATLVSMLLATFLAATFTNGVAQAAGDPRKCDSAGGRIAQGQVDGPTFCAYQSATLAFRRYMTAITHRTVMYSAPMTCTQGATNLLWTCAFADGKGTVRFRALSNGWHTRVTVACTNPALTAAAFCRP